MIKIYFLALEAVIVLKSLKKYQKDAKKQYTSTYIFAARK